MPSFLCELYILDLPWQDRDWYAKFFIVDDEWEMDVEGVRVRAITSFEPRFSNNLVDIEVSGPKFIIR